MTHEELIAKQQLEIENLKQEKQAWIDAETEIYGILFSIGGPLNDNRLGYIKEQLAPFRRIRDILDGIMEVNEV